MNFERGLKKMLGRNIAEISSIQYTASCMFAEYLAEIG